MKISPAGCVMISSDNFSLFIMVEDEQLVERVVVKGVSGCKLYDKGKCASIFAKRITSSFFS